MQDVERRTVVACSGGADSVALAIALSSVQCRPVIAHVVHDFRPEHETRADAEHVRGVASVLGCSFLEDAVRVASLEGNAEQNARVARYDVLDQIADRCGCGFIATGHHADDHAETVLMRLIRGAGVRGLSGILDTRGLQSSTLVRPMLGVRRVELEQLCSDAGIGFRHDPSNDDLAFTRNRIRRVVIPALEGVRADAVDRIVDSAASCRKAADTLAGLVDLEMERWERVGGGIGCSRAHARVVPEAVIDGVLRGYVVEAHGGRGLDRVNGRSVGALIDAVRGDSTDPTIHRVGPIIAEVDAHRLVLSIAGCEGDCDE